MIDTIIDNIVEDDKQIQLLAVSVRGVPNLTYNKVYTTLNGIEDGIFLDRPIVTVIDDYNKPFGCHFSRFQKINSKEKNEQL